MRTVQFRTALLTIVAAVALAGVAQAGAIITNTFEAATPIDVNGVHALGVTFEFSGGSATYGDSIGTDANELAPLTDPLLGGSADGVLTLVFDNPSTFLSFDIAFTTSGGPGGQVTIGGDSQNISTSGDSGLFGLYSIGTFSWTPDAPFTQAVITFDAPGSEFAIDNLSYDDPPSAPEPASMALMGGGFVLVGLVARKRNRR